MKRAFTVRRRNTVAPGTGITESLGGGAAVKESRATVGRVVDRVVPNTSRVAIPNVKNSGGHRSDLVSSSVSRRFVEYEDAQWTDALILHRACVPLQSSACAVAGGRESGEDRRVVELRDEFSIPNTFSFNTESDDARKDVSCGTFNQGGAEVGSTVVSSSCGADYGGGSYSSSNDFGGHDSYSTTNDF